MLALARRRRSWLFTGVLIGSVLLTSVATPAAIQMSTGLRYVSPDGSASDCSAKATSALKAFLQDAAESSPGSGEWVAFGPAGATVGVHASAATVRCYPLSKGYVVTFTCAVQVPGSPYSADDLCLAVERHFTGKPSAPLPTAFPPTPVPTGCSTVNLVGTWVADNKPGQTLELDLNGNLTDNEGVSGNWGLNGMSVALTYYGNHTLTLSADGKHITGEGLSFTRKC
ncbi:MAG: hypothetical protein WA814_12750 [Candidatus Baltobacteraceae bacterium]